MKTQSWYQAQLSCIERLRELGLDAQMAISGPFDILVNQNIRIEVKFGKLRKSPRTMKTGKLPTQSWCFNIHRHGVVDESEVDLYMFCCEIPNSTDINYYVRKAPISRQSLNISTRNYSKWPDFKGVIMNYVSNNPNHEKIFTLPLDKPPQSDTIAYMEAKSREIHARITGEMYRALETMAEADDSSVSKMVRRAINEFLQKRKEVSQ